MRPSVLTGILGGQLFRTVTPYNRVATSGQLGAAGSGPLRMASRLVRDIGSGDVSVLRVRLDNIAFKTDTSVGGFGSAHRIINCFIECNGQSKRVTFGGSNTTTIADGSYDTQSDDIYPSLFGLSVFSRNTSVRIRIEVEVDDGGRILVLEGTDASGAEGKYFYPDSGAAWTNPGGTGVMAFSGTSTTSFGYPAILIGRYVSGDPRTFGLVGDSIFAQGNQSSYGVKALYRDSANLLSGMQVGRVGGQQSVQGNYPAQVGSYTKLFNTAIEEYGTNGSGGTLSAQQSNALASWAFLRGTAVVASGVPFKIVRPWLLNRVTNGTNCAAGADPALQVLQTNFGSGGIIEQLNDWYTTQIGVGNGPDIVVDPMSGVGGTIRANQTRGNALYYKWDTTATYTADGLHPNSAGASILGANLASTLLAA